MQKVDVNYTDFARETIKVMSSTGAFLVSGQKTKKANVMAIGWGTIGFIWGKPVFIVLVRPSRFTYGFIEEAGDFTVNIPCAELRKAVTECGEVSGRDHNKFSKCGLTPVDAKCVKSPIISECIVHYECKVVHRNDVVPAALAKDIIPGCYPKGNFHTLFFGEIVACSADADARSKLKPLL